METKEFDSKLQELLTEMVEASFEYVGKNKEEVNEIYIYASMESSSLFYNVFYLINGKLTKAHKVNDFLSSPSATPKLNKELLRTCTDFLDEVYELFEEDEREVPTLMKMVYSPKTGAFDNAISYDLHYSDHPERTEVDGFNEWFEELKSAQSNEKP